MKELSRTTWTAEFFKSIFGKRGIRAPDPEVKDYILRVEKVTTDGIVDIVLLEDEKDS